MTKGTKIEGIQKDDLEFVGRVANPRRSIQAAWLDLELQTAIADAKALVQLLLLLLLKTNQSLQPIDEANVAMLMARIWQSGSVDSDQVEEQSDRKVDKYISKSRAFNAQNSVMNHDRPDENQSTMLESSLHQNHSSLTGLIQIAAFLRSQNLQKQQLVVCFQSRFEILMTKKKLKTTHSIPERTRFGTHQVELVEENDWKKQRTQTTNRFKQHYAG